MILKVSGVVLFLSISTISVQGSLDCSAVDGVPEQSQQNFVDKANAITDAIQNAWLETLTYPQLALANLVASPTFPLRQEFEKFAASNKYWNPQKTIFQLEWVPQVVHAQRNQFEASVKAEVPSFEIYTFGDNGTKVPRPQNSSSVYYPIVYCSPPADSLLGLDLNDDVEGPSILQAKSTGQAAVSEPFILRGATPGIFFKMGMTMYMPLFLNSSGVTESWTKNYYGCLVSVFVFHPLVNQVLQSMNLESIDVFVFWIQVGNGSNTSSYVAHFESGPSSSMPNISPEDALSIIPEDVTGDIVTNYSSQFDITMGDRIFRIKVRARTGSITKDVMLLSKWAPSHNLLRCSKMSTCAASEQGALATIVAQDAAQREITYQIVGTNSRSVCTPRGVQCNITITQDEVGLYIIEVFADGIQITDSPVLLNVTSRLCPDPRVPDEHGNCICDLKADFDVGGTCVPFKTLFPSVILPVAFLVSLLVVVYFSLRIAQEEVQWRIDPKELMFCDPEEVLGSGSQGDVVKAYYRGTPVAVKRFRKKAVEERRTSLGSFEERRGSLGAAAAAPLSNEFHRTASNDSSMLDSLVRKGSFLMFPTSILGSGGAYKQLRRDMKKLAGMRHPSIATLMGVADLGKGGGTNQGLCMVLELMELGSLWDLLHNKTFPIQGKTALQFLQDIARGMRFLHGNNPPLLHGDLKSGNVLVDRTFSGKISDFGLAPSHKRATGTPLWMSPECLSGASGNTTASDVWSFGVVVYEILTRQCPYEGEDVHQVSLAVSQGRKRLPVPPGCSAEVAALMNDCFCLDPARRPPFSELDRRLDALDPSLMTSPAFAEDPEPAKVAEVCANPLRGRLGSVCSEAILADLFPAHVAEALLRGEKVPPEHKEIITMFFSDIVGFTTLSAAMPPDKVSGMLDRLFDQLDRAAERLGVYKIETIGDAYLCATNIVSDQRAAHAGLMARFAVEAVAAAAATPVDEDDPAKGPVRIRVGLASGPCMASVVGRKSPKYTLFGDTINTASRMESNSVPGRIQCTARTADLIRQQDGWVRVEQRGTVDIKGKGPMVTYWVAPGDGTPPEAAPGGGVCTPAPAPAVLLGGGEEDEEAAGGGRAPAGASSKVAPADRLFAS